MHLFQKGNEPRQQFVTLRHGCSFFWLLMDYLTLVVLFSLSLSNAVST